MTNLKSWALVAAGLALSACGGGGTGTGGGTASFAAQLQDLQSDPSNFIQTDPGSLPTGSATYRGVAGFNTTDLDSVDPNASPQDLIDSIEGYYGALSMSVNFAGNTLSGSVTDMQDFDGNSASGSVTIASGTVTQAGNAIIGGGFATTASGTIAGESYTWDVDGNFTGDNGDAMSVYFEDTGDTDTIGVGIAAR